MAAPTRKCGHCGAVDAPNRCGRCKQVYFCGEACQRAAWPSHKSVCAPPGAAGGAAAAPSTAATPVVATAAAAPATSAPSAAPAEALAVLKQLHAAVRAAAGGGHVHFPPGSALGDAMDGAKFTRMAFPGVSTDDIMPEAPRTLLALLDRVPPWQACEEGAVRALAKAKSVIASVKQRAARAGETLDAATEKALLPQAFGEAFVRDVATTMRGVLQEATGNRPTPAGSAAAAAAAAGPSPAATASTTRSAGAAAAPTTAVAAADDASSLLASPYHVLAACDYIPGAALAELTNAAVGWAATSGPFASDDAEAWGGLVLDDLRRLSTEQADRWATLRQAEWSLPPVEAAAAAASAATAMAAAGGSTVAAALAEPPSAVAAAGTTAAPGTPATGAAALLRPRCAVTTSYAWVDPSEKLDAEYPALSEVLQRLHSLPYELNRKLPSLKLTRPHPGMTLVRRISLLLTTQPPSAAAGLAATASSGAAVADSFLPFGDAFQLDAAGASVASGGAAPDLRDYKLTCTAAAGAAVALDDAGADIAEEGPAVGDSARPWAKLAVRLQRGGDVTTAKLQPMHAPNTLLLHRSREMGARWELHAAPKRLTKHLAAMAAAGVGTSQLDVFVVQFFVHGPAGGPFA